MIFILISISVMLVTLLECPAFYFKENLMSNQQLQRLQQDSAQLEMFVNKLESEGKLDLVKKIKAKKEYLDKYITTKRVEAA
tara:strand:+ start:2339 stop:2584 length:246 start_codon:yes stop_codon:yes gene_type:complete